VILADESSMEVVKVIQTNPRLQINTVARRTVAFPETDKQGK
jgi:hypothetical protein